MNGSTLTYEQINAASSNLNQYATEMQAILDEIVSYLKMYSSIHSIANNFKFETKVL